MILLVGHQGYLGNAFQRTLNSWGLEWRGLSRGDLDYGDIKSWLQLLKDSNADLVINAAGFTGVPNVDACETQQGECIQANVLLPVRLAEACDLAGCTLGHLSSGCIYQGALLVKNSAQETMENLLDPDIQANLRAGDQTIRGYSESNEPNFCFERGPCSFYSGCKALAEKALENFERVYLWRPRMPFDRHDHAKNLLSKFLRYDRIYNNWNSMSHRGDFSEIQPSLTTL